MSSVSKMYDDLPSKEAAAGVIPLADGVYPNGREKAKEPYLRSDTDPDVNYISPSDAMRSVDTVYDDFDAIVALGGIPGPPGDKGDKGDQGDPGPQGDKGDTGPVNSLIAGQADTLAPGSPVSIVITGEAPNQVLNIGIPQGASGSPLNTIDAKGDLLVGSANDTAVRLPVGVAGTNPLLIPDTSASGGLKWGTWAEADVVQRSLYDANTILAATDDNTPVALTVGESTLVGRASTGNIAALTGAQVRAITGLATTDSPTFAGGTIGAASAGPTIGPELGNGVSATQALTGLTVGLCYQVAAIGGTLGAATLDGAALAVSLNATSFVATATSHTVAKTAGTATGISVKAITAVAAAAPTVGGASVRVRNQSYFVGGTGGQWLTTGSSNNGVGQNALNSLTTGSYNNAFGQNSLRVLITGSYNNATGCNALYSLTTGSSNNAFGQAALYSLTTGSFNNAVGQNALNSLTTGLNNNAFGHNALCLLTTGSQNNAIGSNALYSLTTGSQNNAIGHTALTALTTGSFNNGVGYHAGRAHTTGSYNLALGHGAAYTGSAAGLSGTVAIGDDSLGTGAVVTANDTIALGTPLHSMRCGAVGSDSGLWAFGVRKAGAVTLDSSQYITVKVDGQTYKLALAQ